MQPKNMKVNKVRCATCPFNENGDPRVRESVTARCLSVGSQKCHHTHNKTLCRGARDLQLRLFVALGVLKEPTDECWTETYRRITHGRDRRSGRKRAGRKN